MYTLNALWESLNFQFDCDKHLVVEPQELEGNIISFDFHRGDSFQLLCEIEANSAQVRTDFFDGGERLRSGQVIDCNQLIEFKSQDQIDKYSFENAYFLRTPSLHINPHNSEKKRSGTINIPRFKFSNIGVDNVCTVNWLLNINFDVFLPKNCHMYIFKNRIEFDFKYREIKDDSTFITHSNRNCIYLKYDDIDIFIAKLPKEIIEIEDVYHSGFIFFNGDVDEQFVEKFRNAVAFMFGRNLVPLGIDKFSANGKVTQRSAFSPYIITAEIFSKQSFQPCSFENEFKNIGSGINYESMENFIAKIIESYDEMELDHVFWMYWHSMYAPLHTQAGGYGAIIEFILSRVKIETTLIKKSEFKPFRLATLKEFEIFCEKNKIIDQELIGIISNKISGLNELPIAKKTKKQFEKLGLEISSFESGLWQRRHDSAHGNSDTGHFHDLVREVNAFRSFCNRTIMTVLDNSDNYIDYYNYDYPVNLISTSLKKVEE